ncbi:Sterol desaturase/sphingolipid hydroxylase, fatty acid hydroxylase superfamily [Variovorax sp. PDC80]|uniref:lysoplasmalogenase family protein n=1 Tax=Variovorax sp. PDC80 TaxID=1882827 RepID=UPI0008EBEFDF|nr:lysoplasmalogenase family protein [Variovorax sp. PDC80]SFP07553.1 Sterol desaturase/sphingolipid hydroxylase, fatty acid hydroxylase superfamily [Variovorax sp. PDC80]
MRPGQIIVLATPVFFLLIAIEFAVGRVRARRGTGQDTYRLADAVNSIGLGMLSQISAVLTGLLRIGIYTAVYSAVALFPDTDFWTTWYGWLLALVFYDFCYYWLHRMGHESAVLWAAHVVHHQSQHYNLSTALRQTSSGALLGWIFYMPMAAAGVPPLVFAVVSLVDLLYQFWVHTEQVGRLGWFDRWFCSPSNHRVHHAVNDRYLDRNYGGILIVWDRLFGSFKEEDERCVYGTRSPLASWDPLWANAEVYWGLAKDSWHARSWGDKLRVWLKSPGWRPADVAARFPKPAFDIAQVRRYEPEVGRGVQWFAGVQFLLLLAAVAVFLWFSDGMPLSRSSVWLAALTAALWAIGGVLQGRLSIAEALLVEAAALATASAALGLPWLHHATKPLALAIAVFIATRRALARPGGMTRFDLLLVAGLVGSLAGDVLLMGPASLFVPGLVCFLLAHLAYIGVFRIGVGFFPRPAALAVTLAIGAAMYAFLWQGGLPAALRIPVALYVLVIACMAAQALGRAFVLRDTTAGWGAGWVAAGACCFMLSDALLATNRFVAPLPLAQLWVLATYYVAQTLIVRHARPPG